MEAVKLNNNLSEERKQQLSQCAEPCESGLFSAYVDANGKYWHCSFGEDRADAGGIDLTKTTDFVKEVWHSKSMNEWRTKLFSLNRECPLYPEIRVDAK